MPLTWHMPMRALMVFGTRLLSWITTLPLWDSGFIIYKLRRGVALNQVRLFNLVVFLESVHFPHYRILYSKVMNYL